jgi:hypothetical protein
VQLLQIDQNKLDLRKPNSIKYLSYHRPCFDSLILELMQINMPLCIIYKLVNVVYEKTVYDVRIFVSERTYELR